MDSDSESYFEESSSEAEEEVAGTLYVNLENNLEESPEPPPPRSPSPVLPSQPFPVGELSSIWGCRTTGQISLIVILDRMCLR